MKSDTSWGVSIEEWQLVPGKRSTETLQAVPRHTSLKDLMGYVNPTAKLLPRAGFGYT